MNIKKPQDKGKISNVTFVKKIVEVIKGPNGSKIIMFVGIAGIVLIGISSILPKRDTESPQKQIVAVENAIEEYTKKLEQEVTTLVSQVEGAGKTQVMITLESGKRYVYADERRVGSDTQDGGNSSSSKDDSQNSFVIIDTEDGKQGLLITELEPQVKGVVVVCEGGNDALVNQKITDLLTTLLNLSTRRVCVVKLETTE